MTAPTWFGRLRAQRGLAPLPSAPTRGAVQLAAKMVLAGTLAWWLCRLLGAPRPLFAVLVPLVAMGGDPFGAVNVSIGRILGVFAGVLIGLGLLHLQVPSTVLVALLLALSLMAGLALRVGGGPLNNQIAITAMFMLYLGVGAKAQSVGVARIWETAVGAGVAVSVSALVWPPDPLKLARCRVDRLRGWLREDLERVAELLSTPDAEAAEDELALVRERSLEAGRDVLELERGERALRLNPRRRTDAAAFAVQRQGMTAAASQYRHLRALARTVADAASEQPPIPTPERDRLAGVVATIAGAAAGQPARLSVDLGSVHDPRAVGVAVQLRQMAEDLNTEDLARVHVG